MDKVTRQATPDQPQTRPAPLSPDFSAPALPAGPGGAIKDVIQQTQTSCERARDVLARAHQAFAHTRQLLQQTTELQHSYRAHQERRAEEPAQSTLPGLAPPTVRPAETAAPLDILLIEDNRADITLFCRALAMCNSSCRVTVVTTRGELNTFLHNYAARCASARLRLIVLDSALPGMAAEEIVAAVRRFPMLVSIPTVLFSGLTEEAGQHLCLRCAATAFVHKPGDLQEFFDCVAAMVRLWALLPTGDDTATASTSEHP